ncbi:MAG TPA: polysaccharide deacetylase family protein, partial [Candidatus Limnocylindria bacterium]|nr:polysaccharide deacetylase family protein [Candidatus Limnocylindria bacterium]
MATPLPTLTPTPLGWVTPAPATGVLPWDERLVLVTRWLLEGAQAQGFTFVKPAELLAAYDHDYPALLDKVLADTEPPAKVLSGSPILAKAVSVVFEGTADEATIESILTALAMHGIRTTFFLPGDFVARNPLIAKRILESGHSMGNYLMKGEKKAQELLPEAILRSARYAQSALRAAGTTARYFKGSVTELTPLVLKAAYAAGSAVAVSPGFYVNHTSFATFEQALGYAKRTPSGAILCVKMGLALEAAEMPGALATPSASQRGAYTIPPSSYEIRLASPEPTHSRQEWNSLAHNVTWLLDAFAQEGVRVIPLEQLETEQQTEYARLFRELYSPNSTQAWQGVLTASAKAGEANVFTSRPVLKREISLIVENIASEATMNSLLDLLLSHNAKAIFFAPAAELAKYPQVAVRILREGHQLGNYGFNGEKGISLLASDAAMASLWRAQQTLRVLTGVTPALFKGHLTEYTPSLLAYVKALGMSGAVKPTRFINHNSFATERHAETFATATEWGTILSIKLNQVIDVMDVGVPAGRTATPNPMHTPSPTRPPFFTPYVAPTPAPLSSMGDEDKLLVGVGWLLDAYGRQGVSYVTPEQIERDWVREMTLLDNMPLSPSGTKAELIENSRTTEKKVSIVISHIPDAAYLARLRSVFKELGITASFAVTGDEVVSYRDQLLVLLSEGHSILT